MPFPVSSRVSRLPKELRGTKVLPKISPNIRVGVNDLEDIVVFVAQIANILKAALSGPVSWLFIIPRAPKLAISLVNAISGISNIPAELSDIDDKEKDKLIAKVKDTLEFPEDAENVIGIALNIAYGLKALVGVFK